MRANNNKANIIIYGTLPKMLSYCTDMARRVYDSHGISPTITTMGGGGTQPKVIEVKHDDNT